MATANGYSDSILLTIQKMLGIDSGYEVFNTDIIVFINSALMVLRQIGVGPEEGFSITGSEETWSDFLGDNLGDYQAVKSYLYLKVKTMFDPPSSSFVMDAMKSEIDELEWRLNVHAETIVGNSNGSSGGNSFSGDYNDLENKPSLDGIVLQGEVVMNIANKDYVDERIGEIEYGSY